MPEQLKYRINELLEQLPVKDYSKALKALPKILNVSIGTFNNWRTIKINESQDIPHEKVALLEALFSIRPGDLQNFTVPAKSLTEQLHEDSTGTIPGHASKYGLAKH